VLALWTLLAMAPLPGLAPALAAPEIARYRVAFGPLDVGEISLRLASLPLSGAAGTPVVRARGEGAGAILGFGRQEGAVETEFEPRALLSRRWTMTRVTSGRTIRDEIDQPEPGHLELQRVRDGGPPQRQTSRIAGAALDPVGFLLRLRASPPRRGAGPEVLHLLDGQALWRVTVTRGAPAPLAPFVPAHRVIRLEGRAEPIRHDGAPDLGERAPHSFVLWLSAGRGHLPLRLEMPLGPSELVVSLASVEGNATTPEERDLGRHRQTDRRTGRAEAPVDVEGGLAQAIKVGRESGHDAGEVQPAREEREPDLSTVRVAGEGQVHVVRGRLREQRRIVGQQHHGRARGPAGDGGAHVVARGPGVVDAGNVERRVAATNLDPAIAQEGEAGALERVGHFLSLGEVVVVPHAGVDALARPQPAEAGGHHGDVGRSARDEVAGHGHEVSLELVDGRDPLLDARRARERTAMQVGDLRDPAAVERLG
jgi:hypothetical protein